MASKRSQDVFGEASKSRISISGTEPLLHFCDSAQETHCHCKPCPNAGETPQKVKSIKKLKPQIKHLELVEPGPIRGVGPNDEVRLTKLLRKLESFADSNNGGMIASATSLCPNLKVSLGIREVVAKDATWDWLTDQSFDLSSCVHYLMLSLLQSLTVLQTPLPFTLALAASLISSCPNLKHLTYRTPHLDASALALAICNLRELTSFDVSGVRSCWCRGAVGRTQGMMELASALSRARNLKRMVFTACKVFSVDNSALLFKLGKASREGTAICSHGHAQVGVDFGMSLSSLEIRRSPVSGKSLAFFLSSPSCQDLKHLFIGGCAKVGQSHLIQAFKSNLSSTPLDLEIDGYLVSNDLLKMIGSRLSNLRLFEPNLACLDFLTKALVDGTLSNLLRLTIIPSEDTISEWICNQDLTQEQYSTSLKSSTQSSRLDSLTITRFIKLLKERNPVAEVRIGDGPWMRMREAIADRKWWADQMLEQQNDEEVERDQNEWSGGVDVY